MPVATLIIKAQAKIPTTGRDPQKSHPAYFNRNTDLRRERVQLCDWMSK